MEKDTPPNISVINFAEKRPRPSMDEGRERLDRLFLDFKQRGAQPSMIANMILSYGICEVINYSAKPEDGLAEISKILSNSFSMDLSHEVYFDPDF